MCGIPKQKILFWMRHKLCLAEVHIVAAMSHADNAFWAGSRDGKEPFGSIDFAVDVKRL
jgi:hypothetical protein